MEKWKKLPVEGKKGEIYEVSNLGKMRKWHPNEKKPQMLKGSIIRGYRVFNTKLTNGKGTSLYIHKLIAEQFVNKKNKEQQFVIHKDFDKDNNDAENLKWATKEELNLHHKKNPNILNMERPKGLIRYSKLTIEEVKEIKKLLLSENVDKNKISKKYKITVTQLNRIQNGKNWGNVTI